MSLCSVCKVKNATGECQKCKNRAYCGSACQMYDWKEQDHKLHCDHELRDNAKIGLLLSPFKSDGSQKNKALYMEMIVAVQKNSARVTQNPLQAAKFKQFFTSGIEINPNEKMPRNVARSKELDYYTVDIKRGVPIRQDSLLVFATNKQGEVTAQVVAILVYTDAGRYPEGVNLDGTPSGQPAPDAQLWKTNVTLKNHWVWSIVFPTDTNVMLNLALDTRPVVAYTPGEPDMEQASLEEGATGSSGTQETDVAPTTRVRAEISTGKKK